MNTSCAYLPVGLGQFQHRLVSQLYIRYRRVLSLKFHVHVPLLQGVRLCILEMNFHILMILFK